MSEFRLLLGQNLRGICDLSEEQTVQLESHYSLMVRWNKRLNLTSLKDVEEIVVRHYCESLYLGSKLPREPLSVADLGSGAGFPGLPAAVLRPDIRMTLVESHARKCVFMREASRCIANVSVAEARAEGLAEEFDWVLSRAVRPTTLLPAIRGLSGHVALLLGYSEAENMRKRGEISWDSPVELPWGHSRVLLIGRVPRGT